MDGAGRIYAEARHRISEIVGGLSEDETASTVPACPQWTVRDVVSHLAGSCADAVAGRMDGVTTAAWADAHVHARRERTMAELVEEWSTFARPLEADADRLPAELRMFWILDVTVHEHDVRGAVGQPGARQSAVVLAVVDFLVREGLHRQLLATGIGPLSVHTPDASWVIGPEPVSGQGAACSASSFDLFRALTGRRSRAQIARFDWSVDPEPFLPAFQFGTFTTRDTDLDE